MCTKLFSNEKSSDRFIQINKKKRVRRSVEERNILKMRKDSTSFHTNCRPLKTANETLRAMSFIDRYNRMQNTM